MTGDSLQEPARDRKPVSPAIEGGVQGPFHAIPRPGRQVRWVHDDQIKPAGHRLEEVSHRKLHPMTGKLRAGRRDGHGPRVDVGGRHASATRR